MATFDRSRSHTHDVYVIYTWVFDKICLSYPTHLVLVRPGHCEVKTSCSCFVYTLNYTLNNARAQLIDPLGVGSESLDLFLEFGQPLVHLLHLRGCRRYLWRIRCRCTLGDWLEWLRVLWALLGQSLQLFSKCCNVLPRACWLRHFLHARCHLWIQRRNSSK